ncbi:DUF3006 domain-containing protein [Clostridium thermarum]|uniref:DUF3006 domain-containing protein n=1 Tax=Clostridium thermarum TaxID=1716543 RepID=UPI0011228F74|nr:DUF3006 domain-containing protein [Clostridium thermarum]
MFVVIDRFEGNYAVCEKEDRTIIDISRDKLPPEAKVGDVLIITEDVIVIDIERTKEKKREIEELTKDLWA